MSIIIIIIIIMIIYRIVGFTDPADNRVKLNEAKREIRDAFNKFPDFFCTGIYNWCRLLKIQYVIAIHLMI